MIQPFARRSHPASRQGCILETGSRWHTSYQLECGNGLCRSAIEPDLRHGRAARRGSQRCIFSSSGLQTAWKVAQTTTEFIAIMGPPDQRVIVGSNIPEPRFRVSTRRTRSCGGTQRRVRRSLRSARLPAMTSGTMVQPYYFGDMFYPGAAGSLYKLQPAPAGSE